MLTIHETSNQSDGRRDAGSRTGGADVKGLSLRRPALLICGLVVFVACLATGDAEPQTEQKKWSPQFPREGAIKVFENDRVVVWEQVWPNSLHMHKHVRDIITIGLDDGGIKSTRPDGTVSRTMLSRTIPGGKTPGFVGYATAGLGPHAEQADDPKSPPRALVIELKGTEPKDCRDWSLACP
jgi:hypothetical protein